MDLTTFLRDMKATLKELDTCKKLLEVPEPEESDSRKQVPASNPRKDSLSKERLHDVPNLEGEARKAIDKIRNLSGTQHEEKASLIVCMESLLDMFEPLCVVKTAEGLPLSDYVEIAAYEQALHNVLKEVTQSQAEWNQAVSCLDDFIDVLETKVNHLEEKTKRKIAKKMTRRYKHSIKHKYTIRGTPKCHSKNPRNQVEKETSLPESQTKKLATQEKTTSRASEDDVEGSTRKTNSASFTQCVEELHYFCELLQILCENAIAAQSNVSISFMQFAGFFAFHSKQCFHLAQTFLLSVAFLSQILSAVTNLISDFTASNAEETEAKELILAVRQLIESLPLLQSKFQHLYSDYLYRATYPYTLADVAQWISYKQTGTEWFANVILKHLDTADEIMDEARQKLHQAASVYDIESPSSSTDLEEVDVTEGFLATAKKIKSIGENVVSLINGMKVIL
jgi:hypothetical protein